jgi:integrase
LQERNGSYRILFRYRDKLHSFTIGEVSELDAVGHKAQAEELLRLLKRRLIELPAGCSIEEFLRHRGKPPAEEQPAPVPAKEATFAELRDDYLRTHSNGTLEKNTLDTCKLHLAHFAATLGEGFPIAALAHADLQRHIDRRAKAKNRRGETISPVTIKKEIATLAGVWIWGVRMGMVRGDFPGRGLRYPKTEEPLPFMTWQEIERAIAAGGDPDEYWECLYLLLPDLVALLAYAREHATQPFVYPLMCFAAHTGARRSEIMRALVTDIDWQGQAVLLREKKRARGKLTTRRVPLTPFLRQVLEDWLKVHPAGQYLFCHAGVIDRSKKRSRTTGHKGERSRASGLKARMATVRQRDRIAPAPLSKKEVYYHFKKTLEDSKWEVLKGLHILRHSFISTCASKGIDQRMVDEWVGHATDEQRKRYRHLWPSTQQDAIRRAFEEAATPPAGSAAAPRG